MCVSASTKTMKPTGLKFALLIVCALANVACVPVCKEKQYYSQDMPGCVMCPTAKCEDQYGPDIQRCKEACGKYHVSSF